MVDKPKLHHLLLSLERYLDVLNGLARLSRDEFLDNPDKIGNAKYHFVIAIEYCIDMANHVIASERFRFPNTNASLLRELPDLERVLP